MILHSIPKIYLSNFPTPCDEAKNLANKLGLKKLLIKRDDTTTLGCGGNKVRKLEYLMADAVSKDCDIILTNGGVQSNHARLTAAAAAKLGLKSIIFLGAPALGAFNGNLILDVVFGADIFFMEGASVKDMENAMAKKAEDLRKDGHKPYVIPIGGSTPLGDLGYVSAMEELSQQIEEDNPIIFVAVGTGGTMTGCMLGAKLFLPKADIIGVAVTGGVKTTKKLMAACAKESAKLIDTDLSIDINEINIADNYYGSSYGIPSTFGNDAIMLTGRCEGIALDPIYTGKAMSGLIDMCQRKLFDTDRAVIFIHTGGSVGLFAFEDDFKKIRTFFDIKVDIKPKLL